MEDKGKRADQGVQPVAFPCLGYLGGALPSVPHDNPPDSARLRKALCSKQTGSRINFNEPKVPAVH